MIIASQDRTAVQMASHFIRKPKQKCVSHVLSIKLLLPATWFDSQKGENKTIRVAMQKVLLNAKVKDFPRKAREFGPSS